MPLDVPQAKKRNGYKSFKKEDHPWDALLRLHVETEHAAVINELADVNHVELPPACSVWDVYKEAIAVRERQKFPDVGVSTDRRTFDYTCAVLNDQTIKSLICFACARIVVATGGVRSQIEFKPASWLLRLPKGCKFFHG